MLHLTSAVGYGLTLLFQTRLRRLEQRDTGLFMAVFVLVVLTCAGAAFGAYAALFYLLTSMLNPMDRLLVSVGLGVASFAIEAFVLVRYGPKS